MEVKIEDRKEEIEYLRMGLNMAELGVSYEQADLIIRISDRLKKLKGKFSLKDGVEIHHKMETGMAQKYYEGG